jgi:hypothetical protein
MILFNREQYINSFQKLPRGPGWSNAIQRQVRSLVQQAIVVCNYFPDIKTEPLVIVAFKSFIKNNRVFKIGQYRKTRITKQGKVNITQDEKDVVKGISKELDKLISARDCTKSVVEEIKIPEQKQVSFATNRNKQTSKSNLLSLMELENKINKS